MFLNIILLLIIIVLLVLLSWVWPPHSPWAPWWRTNKKTARAICKLAGINSRDIIYDLGCGDGTLIIIAAKEYGARAVGIEIDPMRYVIAKLRVWFNGLQDRVVIKRKSFFDEAISKATIVNVYLVPKTLNLLLPKFKKELKKGTLIVSYRYEFPLPLKQHDKQHKLNMYAVNH